jgi:hypothetical protein
VFDGKLESLLGELAEEVWKDAAMFLGDVP